MYRFLSLPEIWRLLCCWLSYSWLGLLACWSSYMWSFIYMGDSYSFLSLSFWPYLIKLWPAYELYILCERVIHQWWYTKFYINDDILILNESKLTVWVCDNIFMTLNHLKLRGLSMAAIVLLCGVLIFILIIFFFSSVHAPRAGGTCCRGIFLYL